MQLSRAADYAVRIMVHLAGLPPGTRVRVDEVASALDLPVSFLSKVMQRLNRAQYIRSRRGSGGGFELDVDANTITLLDVVQVMEGPLRINLCLMSPSACSRRDGCVVHPVWRDAQIAMARALQSVSIAQLAQEAAARSAEPGVHPNGRKRREATAPRIEG